MSTVLLLIDLQNDYFPGGAMELVEPEAAAKQAARLIHAFRENALPIVHIQHIAKRAGATFFLPGTPGADIHTSVAPRQDEPVVVKHFPSSFRETSLHDLLRSLKASRLVIAGMMTHMCIDTTVRAAFDLGYECVVAADACATKDLVYAGERVQAHHVQLAFLAALKGTFATVESVSELLDQTWSRDV